jgi:hypothetical protein
MDEKVFAVIFGARELKDGDELIAIMESNATVVVADQKATLRKTTYALGRNVDTISKIEFFTTSEKGDRAVIASATCNKTHWTVAYNDGKDHAEDVSIIERSEARKPNDTWKDVSLENGARDLGPDVALLTHRVLAEAGLVERKSNGGGEGLKVKLSAMQEILNTLIATLKATGMSEDQIAALTTPAPTSNKPAKK